MRHKNERIVEILIKIEADVNAKNMDGTTVLLSAAKGGRRGISTTAGLSVQLDHAVLANGAAEGLSAASNGLTVDGVKVVMSLVPYI